MSDTIPEGESADEREGWDWFECHRLFAHLDGYASGYRDGYQDAQAAQPPYLSYEEAEIWAEEMGLTIAQVYANWMR